MSTELAAIMMGADPLMALAIERSCIRWQITSTLEKSHFLAQISVESARYTRLRESLNYTVGGLLDTFGRHRISVAQAYRYGRTATQRADQQAIANIVYGGEWGRRKLGNTQEGDGWRFIGRGLKQLTGRYNYAQYSPDVIHNPELLEHAGVAADSAGWFWNWKGCGVYAARDDTVGLTRLINGGLNGLAAREAELIRAKSIFHNMTRTH